MADGQAPPPPDAIKRAAEIRYLHYASEYNADHLTWRDFEDEAREILAPAAEILRAEGAKTERQRIRDGAHKVVDGPFGWYRIEANLLDGDNDG